MNPRPVPSINPHHLGPLDEGPLPADGPGELFAGEDRYLGAPARKKRVELWTQVAPRVAPLLEEGEQVLYVAPAIRNPTLGEHLGLGWMAFQYNQVCLILTDRRIVELQLGFGGKKPAEQIRSYPWRALQTARFRWGKLQAKPAAGRGTTWTLRTRGDRKLVKQLVAQVESRGMIRGDAVDASVPTLHCPRCTNPLPPRPAGCDACNARFRSAKVAAVLSLAFPGGGLLYAGRPVLAAFDFLGELMLLLVFGVALATAAEPAVIATLAVMAAFFLLLTKLESLHVGHVMVSRVQIETPERASRFRRLAKVGAVVSLIALAILPAVTGRFAAVVDRELDFAAAEGEWHGTRSPDEWVDFRDDPALRSQWFRPDGLVASVFSYALSSGETFQTFQRDLLAGIEQEGRQVLAPPRPVPAPFEGFEVTQGFGSGAERYAIVQYFIFDRDNDDVHQVLTVVPEAESEDAERAVGDLLLNGRWLR